jgi:hypothetical protein
MCYLRLTRYTCKHLSPIHPLDYIRPGESEDKMQSDPRTEWPKHPDTGCEGCQDACLRGARCSGKLETLQTFYEDGKGECEDCRDGMAVGKQNSGKNVRIKG